MLWIHELIGTVQQIETAKPKEGLAPQPQKMWINSAQKATVSLATNRATSLRISRINLRTKPTNLLSKMRKLKPAKPLLSMKKIPMKKAPTMGAQKQTPGFIKVGSFRLVEKKISFVRLGKLKQECWLVLRQIFKDGNPVGLGTPSQIRIED